MKLTFIASVVFSLLSTLPRTGIAQQLLRSVHSLEDPRGYCLDIPGFGPRMQIDAPIYTHSCKYSLPGFDVDELLEHTNGALKFVNFDRCLAADSIAAGASVRAGACAGANGWRVHDDGRVTPESAENLCLTLADARTFVNTGIGTVPPYSTRDVTLEPCSVEAAFRQAWRWSAPDERTTYVADSLRDSIPLEIQRGNAEIGAVIDPRATAALYSDAHRTFGPADVIVSEELAYGPDDRQRLQVFVGKNRNPPGGAAPIVLFVHGGGFAGGSLANLTHAATHFAGLGFVAVNMTYPLAPEHTWPSGAQSVAAAVEWIAANAATYRGDPERIYIMGHSAGAAHVADYVLRPSLWGGDRAAVAGAILCSPYVELNLSGPSENPSGYFASPSHDWSEMPLLTNIEDASVPLLITVTQYDPDGLHQGTARLFARLIDDFGARPRLRQIPGHGHISYVSAIGTGDTLLLEEALDFILHAP